MQAELNSEVALSAANALIAHLRKNPGAAATPARELAKTFGLDEGFVAQVLQGVNANRRPEIKTAGVKRSRLNEAGDRLRQFWLRVTARPILFVIVTIVLCYAAVFAVSNMPFLRPAPRGGTPGSAGLTVESFVAVATILAIIATTFLLHMAVYFRHRSARHAIVGGLLVYLSLLLLLGSGFLFGGASLKTSGTPNMAFLFLVGAMGLLMIALMYVGMGSLAAVLGGWARFKLQERAEESMSRQDLLERCFELQSRLQQSVYPRATTYEPPVFKTPAVRWYRRNQFLVNILVGFVVQLVALLALRASGVKPGQTDMPLNAWFFVVIFVSISEFLVYIGQGYVSKSALTAALGALSMYAGTMLTRLIPIPGLADRSEWTAAPAELLGLFLNVGISCAGYLGAAVQNRAIKEANLQRNDQATLLAEMVRLQWKLSNEAAAVCVMVVDAAKSSEMKADANPLAVEYTFREYQEWIESISGERGGKVHSTAGDGAVVAFTTCGLALSAARKIQTEVFRFNKDVNRLKHPFRLRIGLHTGEIIGDIDEVQFTEVIDIAAHIESACPIGGIAVTEAVAQKLPEEDLIDLAVVIDGQKVFLAANPTEYQ